MLQLKRKHQYYYQVQTQLLVTRLDWCDFVIWLPSEGIIVERIYYDEKFIDKMSAKARTFYFDTFLPAVVPCTTITRSRDTISQNGAAHVSTKKLYKRMKVVKFSYCQCLW